MIDKTPAVGAVELQTARLELNLLGVPELLVDGRLRHFPYLKAEALLYYLAVTGRAHSRASLAALLWSQGEEKQARRNLRHALYTLRRGLEPETPLLVKRGTISLAPGSIHLDTNHFRPGIETGSSSDELAAALALWRGTFLEGVAVPDAPVFEEWLAEQRLQYDNFYRQGLFQLAQHYRAEKRLTEARRTIEKLLALDPTHEAAHQQLMRLYLQSGNRAAALRQYETLRVLLVEELGVDPDPTTQALHLELLQAETTPPPAPPVAPLPVLTPRRYRFVGRKQELARLQEIYQKAQGGASCLVMIEGEPGIGKTRLVHEWLATLTEAYTLSTRCFETEQVIPFQPWIDLIRTTLRQTSLLQLGLSDVWLTELAQLVPEIRLQRPDLEFGPLADPELARGRIMQAVYQWLQVMGRERLVCLFIDDMQWLDQASLTLLRYLFGPQPGRRQPWLIVGAQRAGEVMPGWSLFKAGLEREGLLHHLPLHRLSPVEVVALARAISLPARKDSDHFLKRLLAETEGNPLFIVEFMQTLDPATIKSNQQWPTPPTIQGVLQNRLARLGEETRQVLAAAAVLGRVFRDSILQQVVGLPFENILQALDEATAANIITERDEAYDFTHDKIRSVLLEGLTQSRRRYLHSRVAAVLEATLSNDYGLLSYHFEAAGDLLRARNYGLRAARQAVELYADEDALRWYDKVESLTEIASAELSPEAIPKVTPFQQVYVSRRLPLDVLGLVYRQRGLIWQRIGRYDQARAAFELALTRGQTRRRLDEQAAAHNLLSFLAYLRSDYDGVGQHARQALDLATTAGEAALRAPGLRHLGIAVYRTGDYARARQLYDEALAAYRETRDRLGMAGVYNNIGFVLRTEAHYHQAIAAFQQALALYEEIGQVEGIALIHSNIGRTYAFSGDLSQAEQYLKRGLTLSEEAHTDWITVKIHRTLGSVYAQNRQWTSALHHARQARALAESLGSDEDLGAILRLLAELAAAWPTGPLAEPSTYFEKSIQLLQKVGAQDELERAKTAFAAYQKG